MKNDIIPKRNFYSRAYKELRFDLKDGTQFWPWVKGKYIIDYAKNSNEQIIAKVVNSNSKYYNVFDYPKLYLDAVNLDESNTSMVEEFVNKYGLLGTAGWHWEITSLGSKLEQRRLPTSKLICSCVDYVIEETIGKKIPFNPSFYRLYYPEVKLPIKIPNYIDQEVPTAEPLEEFKKAIKCLRAMAQQKAAATLLDDSKISSAAKRNAAINTIKIYLDINFEDLVSLVGYDDMLFLLENLETDTDFTRLHNEKQLLDMSDVQIKNLAIQAQSNMKQEFAQNLKSALRDISWSLSDKLNWMHFYQPGPPSLVPALYLQLAMDSASGKPIRQCNNFHCKRLFAPSRVDNIYCSNSCKDAEKQRAYRERIKIRKSKR